MADENLNKEQQTEEVKTEVQLTAAEHKALDQGWVPKDQWEGDPEDWRPAKEFLDRGELFKKIDDQNRTIKEFKKVVEDLQKHNAKIAKVEYQRAYDALKAQKKEALQEGDADAVIEIDEKIAVVREAQKEVAAAPQPQAPQELNPLFVSWKERNAWYDSNRAMRAFADQIGIEYGSQGMSPSDVLRRVEQEVKKEFPEKFQNPRRNAPAAVEGSSAKGNGGSSKETYELSEDERRVMQRFIKTIPGFNKEQYIADLKKIKGV